jgi:hypothetical protein
MSVSDATKRPQARLDLGQVTPRCFSTLCGNASLFLKMRNPARAEFDPRHFCTLLTRRVCDGVFSVLCDDSVSASPRFRRGVLHPRFPSMSGQRKARWNLPAYTPPRAPYDYELDPTPKAWGIGQCCCGALLLPHANGGGVDPGLDPGETEGVLCAVVE